ncbi:unnamed protein product [Amoebophrya sp. A25]|nr:unnamed protein product [Amoebophrya sp. A25]|eukprot:GSA25T00024296001.1
MGRSSKAELAAKGSEEGGATASGAAKNDKESAGAAPKMKGRKRRRGARVRQKINICWFRRNLRVYHDNPALIKAMSGDLPLLCMYCLTPYMLPSRHRKRKRQFYQGITASAAARSINTFTVLLLRDDHSHCHTEVEA